MALFWGCSAVVVFAALMVAARPTSAAWEWLDVVSYFRVPIENCHLYDVPLADCSQIYVLGNVKTFLTVVKYAPQAWLNFQRKSTKGLSITMFTLDLTGAILSLIQLVIDSASGGDWSGVLGNPAKFALGNVTLFFDLLFLYQHYFLYRGAAEDGLPDAKLTGAAEPLLTGRNTA